MANKSLNKILLIGNVGKDAETTFTPSGVACSKFSVATTRRWKDAQTGDWKEAVDWANVILWKQEKVAEYLKKGTRVYIEGRMQTRNYEDKDGKKVYVTEVVASDVILLGSQRKDEGDNPENWGKPEPGRPKSAPKPNQPVVEDKYCATDDDVPF